MAQRSEFAPDRRDSQHKRRIEVGRQEFYKGTIKGRVIRFCGVNSEATVQSMRRFHRHVLPVSKNRRREECDVMWGLVLQVFEDPDNMTVQGMLEKYTANNTLPVFWHVANDEYSRPMSWGASSHRSEHLRDATFQIDKVCTMYASFTAHCMELIALVGGLYRGGSSPVVRVCAARVCVQEWLILTCACCVCCVCVCVCRSGSSPRPLAPTHWWWRQIPALARWLRCSAVLCVACDRLGPQALCNVNLVEDLDMWVVRPPCSSCGRAPFLPCLVYILSWWCGQV